ncbi:hypothetical protein F5Y19DRAFT_116812 [Xylariaceae sp. FL1651]|nr:hypothetical protein F5Y19DRAFT_116812 [Xylariaceae sp. FL1651]
MQRLGGPPIFQGLLRRTSLWDCQVRYFGSQRKDSPKKKHLRSFYISDLLLDLDAEGAEGVRAFNEELDGVPEPASALKERELQRIKDRVADFDKKYQEYESSFKSISADKYDPFHITDFDLLSVALLGLPSASGMTPNPSTNKGHTVSHAKTVDTILDKNGIPHTARSDMYKTMAYMLHRQQLSGKLSPRLNNGALLEGALRKCRSFSELERTITMAMQTPQNCRLLSELSSKLGPICEVVTKDVPPAQVLSLLNNVIMCLAKHELPISTDLYELAIWTSFQCQAFATAQTYIGKKLQAGDKITSDQMFSMLTRLLQHSISSARGAISEFVPKPPTRLTAIFSLLTGYVPSEEKLQVALGSLIDREKSHCFSLYLRCLARLGAFRTMWHEWHDRGYGSQWGETINADTNLFVTAVLNALAENSEIKNLAGLPGFATATGLYREDIQLDMVAISKSAKSLASPELPVGNFTISHSNERKQLYDIFNEKQIERALSTLQAFIIKKTSR